MDWSSLQEFHRLLTSIHGRPNVLATGQAIADVVIAAVGFDIAVVSVVRRPNELETVAVAGSREARAHLLGTRRPWSVYEEEFDVADKWGSLRFVPHQKFPLAAARGWTPDVPASDAPEAWHPLDALYAPLRAPSGELVGVLSVDLPRDGRRPGLAQRGLLEIFAAQAGIAMSTVRLTEDLRAGEELLRQAFEGAGTGMALLGLAGGAFGRFLRVNPALCRLVGIPAEVLQTMTAIELTHPEDRDSDQQHGALLLQGKTSVYTRDVRLTHGDGTPIWVSITSTIVRGSDGVPLYAVNQIQDISRERFEREELSYRANHDPLTNLPNRAALHDRLRTAIDTARRSGRPGTLIFLDLDQFKAVNDLYGHLAGDRVLAELAQRLSSALDAGATIARIGGDEFAVVADDMNSAAAARMAARIQQAAGSPIDVREGTLAVGVSLGIAEIPSQGAELDDLLRLADRAMYANKKREAR
jgi:diguanylate cyclase (GGDEF)-like protein/PAS domain S-box-containing protein